jgi:hypothetical protein
VSRFEKIGILLTYGGCLIALFDWSIEKVHPMYTLILQVKEDENPPMADTNGTMINSTEE